jgi:hypothetical protein
MESRTGLVLKGVLLTAGAPLLVLPVIFVLSSRAAPPAPGETEEEPRELVVFGAPSHVPEGESWVIVGSRDELPEDVAVAPATLGVLLLETLRLSPRALAVRLQVTAVAAGRLLRVSSQELLGEVFPEVYRGQAVPALSEPANFTAGDFVSGQLLVPGADFFYAYFESTEGGLGALRIHNRSTGAWHAHEIALEAARLLAEPAPEPKPGFEVVDPLVTLPDTDGDGIYDFEEAPEPRSPTPRQLGVVLAPGLNLLDIVAVDEAGNASWETLEVFTTYTPPEEEM